MMRAAVSSSMPGSVCSLVLEAEFTFTGLSGVAKPCFTPAAMAFDLFRCFLGVFLQLNGRNLAAFFDLFCGFGRFLLGFLRVLVGAGGDQQKRKCKRERNDEFHVHSYR